MNSLGICVTIIILIALPLLYWVFRDYYRLVKVGKYLRRGELSEEDIIKKIYGHSKPKGEPKIPLGVPKGINKEECIEVIKEIISKRKGN